MHRLYSRVELANRNATRGGLHEPGAELGRYGRLARRRTDDCDAFAGVNVDRYRSNHIVAVAERGVAHAQNRAQGSTIRVGWPKSVMCFRMPKSRPSCWKLER